MSDAGERRAEPEAEPIDKEAEQRELESAGWEQVERQGKIVWRNPESGHLYPQGVAVALVRERGDAGEAPKKPEGGA
jgi:hypothetical protein